LNYGVETYILEFRCLNPFTLMFRDKSTMCSTGQVREYIVQSGLHVPTSSIFRPN